MYSLKGNQAFQRPTEVARRLGEREVNGQPDEGGKLQLYNGQPLDRARHGEGLVSAMEQ